MEEKNIGLDAGTIWNKLDTEGMMTIKDLLKAVKMDEKRMYLALGWLAREGKVYFSEQKNGTLISLIY